MSKNYMIEFGKYAGKRLVDIDIHELDSYLAWLEGLDNPSQLAREAISEITAYLNDPVRSYMLED